MFAATLPKYLGSQDIQSSLKYPKMEFTKVYTRNKVSLSIKDPKARGDVLPLNPNQLDVKVKTTVVIQI